MHLLDPYFRAQELDSLARSEIYQHALANMPIPTSHEQAIPARFSATGLTIRGWSTEMIKGLLGNPDALEHDLGVAAKIGHYIPK